MNTLYKFVFLLLLYFWKSHLSKNKTSILRPINFTGVQFINVQLKVQILKKTLELHLKTNFSYNL